MRLGTLMLAIVFLAASRGLIAAPCAGFTDIDDSDPFCSNVAWMKNRGITQGCTLTTYCPSDSVSRLQMAIFMNRLADSLFPLTCAAGQVMKWNGGSWTCAPDVNSGGTVTSVTAGAGLTGGTITGTGTLAIAAGGVTAGMLASNGCSNGQVLKYTGSSWACAVDNTAVNAFMQHGNNFGAEATLGTNDAFALNLEAGGQRVMRYVPNTVSPTLIGGNGNANYATAGVRGATIAGGGVVPGNNDPDYDFEGPNFVTDHYGTIGGGYANQVGDNTGTLADRPFAVVAGGAFNVANGAYAAVTGGGANGATGSYAFVGGGQVNLAQGIHAAIGGGWRNVANGNNSTIGGGVDNAATTTATVAGGVENIAGGIASAVGGGSENHASGEHAAIPGGLGNTAIGTGSFAAGRRAYAGEDGCFVWSDGTSWPGCHAPHEFHATAIGGFFLNSGANSAGVKLAPGASSWSTLSDRLAKERFEALDTTDVLARLVEIPIQRWSYREERSSSRHIGPMAQDFHRAFGVGDSDRYIATVDADGVALAAIQGLNMKLEALHAEKDARIAEQAREIAEQRRELTEQRSEIAGLRKRIERAEELAREVAQLKAAIDARAPERTLVEERRWRRDGAVVLQ